MKALASFYAGRRVLITGHTGFKGAWLTEWLAMLGARVTGLSLPPAGTRALFDQLGLAGRCDHRLGDIRDQALVRKTLREVRPDVVFHLAAQALVRVSYDQPVETYQTNLMGTVHLLEALRAVRWPCAAVMVTTDKVYENVGRPRDYKEGDPLGGHDPYSASKACAELAIQSYRRSFFNSEPSRPRVALASARAGNVIGGGDWAPDRIVPDCIQALSRGETIRVRNPAATRPWQHVLEPLHGYLLLGAKLFQTLTPTRSRPAPDSQLATLYSAFNFGPNPGSSRTVQALVEEILKHWPGTWRAHNANAAPHEARFLNLSTAKARKALKWKPHWPFPMAVKQTTDWYRRFFQPASDMREETRAQIRAYTDAASTK